jgi:plastocyanin
MLQASMLSATRHIQYALRLSLSFAVLLGLSFAAHAKVLRLVDQNQQPVFDAVVSYALPAGVSAATNDTVAVMDQLNKQFVPRVLIIQQGQQVTFPNSDDIRHHVYSFSATKPFEIKLFKGSVNQPILFDREGIVVLGCNIHDQMVGYIYVNNQEKALLSDQNGEVVLPDDVDQVNIWHANLSAQNTKREMVDLRQLQIAAPTLNSKEKLVLPLPFTLNAVVEEKLPESTSKFKKKFN